MASKSEEALIKKAIACIDQADLSYTWSQFLSGFLLHAVKPSRAANYFLQACRNAQTPQEAVHTMLSCWKYIISAC